MPLAAFQKWSRRLLAPIPFLKCGKIFAAGAVLALPPGAASTGNLQTPLFAHPSANEAPKSAARTSLAGAENSAPTVPSSSARWSPSSSAKLAPDAPKSAARTSLAGAGSSAPTSAILPSKREIGPGCTEVRSPDIIGGCHEFCPNVKREVKREVIPGCTLFCEKDHPEICHEFCPNGLAKREVIPGCTFFGEKDQPEICHEFCTPQ
ncbi:hypothetical protein BDK51DRAFT_35016 [Blyttiomyces helicus]|uniref:Uncharacterized protein n=1 Tax=Blyttiomyces helicus TaxID=388810 RepID=A0A4P9WJG0_9FUNG|nr:hypothetical protein BDK51DRAFT_35016 [Blyttiomyces helicus]|eukprot:RKO92502.1 hypothetical protein BDK51DRAFT_35016 [Blyttiomyces helicus]